MVEVISLSSPLLIEAVRIWTGWGLKVMPSRDDARLARHFGDDVASKLLPIIKSLEEDFYTSDARFVADNLQEMEVMASEQFRKKQPMVAEEIVKALAWCYSFDFK